MHGHRRARASDYGVQLREKQKVRQFMASGKAVQELLQEGGSSKRSNRRKLVAHFGAPRQRGLPHGIWLHPRRSSSVGVSQIDSRQRAGDQYSVVPSGSGRHRVDSREVPQSVANSRALNLASQRAPVDWVDVNVDRMEGVFKHYPERDELPKEIKNLIVELYSK